MLILHVVGTRPNFMKAAPVIHVLSSRGVRQLLVHTGQHYDRSLSQVFFEELDIPRPDINLDVGAGTAAAQTGAVINKLGSVLHQQAPDWVLAYGDVTSTVATAFAAAHSSCKLAHVEAGLRSFDRRMPEEINRIVTDHLADVLFAPSEDAVQNLIREGVNADRIRLVGNVMIDTLVKLEAKAEARFPALQERWQLSQFALVTLHRQSNVDDPEHLGVIWERLLKVSRKLPLIFPVHPRARRNLDRLTQKGLPDRMVLVEPLSYLDFVALQKHATVVITDSGGIQEEATCLGVPCLTLRDNTERPITISQGTNKLVGGDARDLEESVAALLERGSTPASAERKNLPFWDGKASQRIADVLMGVPALSEISGTWRNR